MLAQAEAKKSSLRVIIVFSPFLLVSHYQCSQCCEVLILMTGAVDTVMLRCTSRWPHRLAGLRGARFGCLSLGRWWGSLLENDSAKCFAEAAYL